MDDKEELSLTTFMAGVMKEKDGDVDAAVKLAYRRITADKALYQRLLVPMITLALEEAATMVMRQTRRQSWGRGHTENSGEASASESLKRGMVSIALTTLYDYPLSGGLKLGEATRPVVSGEATVLLRYAQTNKLRGTWLTLIAEKMRDDRSKVRSVLSDADLRELQTVAEQKVA